MACKYLKIGQGLGKDEESTGKDFERNLLMQSFLSLAPSTFTGVDSTAEKHCGRRGERTGGAIVFCISSELHQLTEKFGSLRFSSRRPWLSGQCGRVYRTSSFWLQGALKLSQVISLKGTLGLQLCCSQLVWNKARAVLLPMRILIFSI